MADKKISELTDGVTPQDTDEFAIARAGSTLSLLWSALKGAVYAPSGTDVAVADGGTGASDASTARSNLEAAPAAAKYVVQTADSELSSEQALSALSTGIVKNTTTTGVLSIAAEGTDYYGPGGTDVAVADGGTGASTASGARTNLGLAVGTDVQAHDADLDSIAALDSSTSGAIASDGAGWVKKTYSQFKTALSLVASDVGLGNVTNDAQLKASALDTDGTLAANSDTKIASQKATKTYVDGKSTVLVASPSADITVSGLQVSLIAGETLVFGDPVYVKSDGSVWKADADGTSTYPSVGISAGAATATNAVTVLLLGVARNDAWSWTVGGIVYLSTGAGLTQTQPSTTDNVIQVIGIATAATRIYVNPQLVYLTHT